jgi:predicted DNA-binding protein (UPF0251 family)
VPPSQGAGLGRERTGIRQNHPKNAIALGKSTPARDDARSRRRFLSSDQSNQITRLLQQVALGGPGQAEAEGALLEQVYAQLRAIAQSFMNDERPGHTLQATALVNEAYIRMLAPAAPAAPASDQQSAISDQPGLNADSRSLNASTKEVEWRDRRHFYRAAAAAMRRILIEHARKTGAQKRGGRGKRVLLNVCDLALTENSAEILAVDDAIMRLEEVDSSAAEIVRLRFFAGLSVEQTAAAVGMSERSVTREWTYARAKLFRMLENDYANEP